MLMNLRAEMARRGIKPKHLAQLLELRLATIYDKLNGKYSFTFDEALAIKNEFFPDSNIEFLFESLEQPRRIESGVKEFAFSQN